MKIENILASTNYLEFINEIDNLVYDLLYSPQNGYTLLSSKEAVKEAQNVIEKFNNESIKIVKKVDFDNAQAIVEDKKRELSVQVKKHYQKEAIKWADTVYQDMIDNCLLCVSINKENKEMIDKLYNRALCAISWIKEVKMLNDDEQRALIEQFNDNFAQTICSNNEEYLPNQGAKKSDPLLFLEIRSLIINNEERFVNLDFAELSQCLAQNDISFFNKLKTELSTYKKTSIKDEILLINSAIEILSLKNDKEKYDFIKQVENDFTFFFIANKKLNEQDKINLVKKRINLFKDTKNEGSGYYKKLLTSSLNE